MCYNLDNKREMRASHCGRGDYKDSLPSLNQCLLLMSISTCVAETESDESEKHQRENRVAG